jgi:hypothetical protein
MYDRTTASTYRSPNSCVTAMTVALMCWPWITYPIMTGTQTAYQTLEGADRWTQQLTQVPMNGMIESRALTAERIRRNGRPQTMKLK